MAPRSSKTKPVTDEPEMVVDTDPTAPDPDAEPDGAQAPVDQTSDPDSVTNEGVADAPSQDAEAGSTDEEPKEAPSRFETTREAPQGGRVIKYMGTADQKVIQAGETANRTLPKLNRALRWNRGNDFIIDTKDFPEVAEEWWDHLVAFDDFEDFTGQPATDISKHQAMFQGMKKIKGQVTPAPGQFPTPQNTSGETIPDFFDSRAARNAKDVSAEQADAEAADTGAGDKPVDQNA